MTTERFNARPHNNGVDWYVHDDGQGGDWVAQYDGIVHPWPEEAARKEAAFLNRSYRT